MGKEVPIFAIDRTSGNSYPLFPLLFDLFVLYRSGALARNSFFGQQGRKTSPSVAQEEHEGHRPPLPVSAAMFEKRFKRIGWVCILAENPSGLGEVHGNFFTVDPPQCPYLVLPTCPPVKCENPSQTAGSPFPLPTPPSRKSYAAAGPEGTSCGKLSCFFDPFCRKVCDDAHTVIFFVTRNF